MEVAELLVRAGFYRPIQKREYLVQQAVEMARAAGLSEQSAGQVGRRFEALPSLIPARPPQGRCGLALIIDIGGTSTKVGLREVERSGTESWRLLFEEANSLIRPTSPNGAGSFGDFCGALAERVRAKFPPESGPLSCGVVWSNALENQRCENGITGCVVQREQYRKGEWFIADLHDGVDLGQVLQASFDQCGLSFERFLIANDTPLTMKASGAAQAGMVASTGLNATLVKSLAELGLGASDDLVVCNAEMGGRFRLAGETVGEADWVDDGVLADTVETMCSGLFLPRLFASWLQFLADAGVPALCPLVEELRNQGSSLWETFDTRDLGLLLYDQKRFMRGRREELYGEQTLKCLCFLAQELFKRSAYLCAIVAYAAISNQLDFSKDLNIALDSRLAREVSLFWDCMRSTLNELTPAGWKISLELLKPHNLGDGSISVPMQGAARGLDTLCF